MPRRDQLFESVTTEGALLPSDFLNRLAQRDREIPGLTPDAYHLGSGEKLNEAISRSWNRVLGMWKSFAPAMQALPASDAGTTLTREKWLLPLFQEVGYGRLQTAKPFEFEGRRYSISHGWEHAPIHLVSFRADLDARSENIVGARTTSPHSMVQEFLNRSTAHVWAIVTNGLRLRLLRDNVSLTRQAFVEFDLQSMMQGELYADFALLWLLLHQSRVEGERAELCWLEKWTQEARQRGARALDQLRDGVEEAITALGSGFLAHPANTALRDKLTAGTLTKQEYFRQLLRVVYRFLFLFAAEDRELLFAENVPAKTRENYLRHYSISRLRRIANRFGGTQHADLWHNVHFLFNWLGSDTGCPALGLPALGSFLWSARATPDLDDCLMANRDLLIAIRALAFTEQNKVRRPIDYKNIGTEELGSVYESLLEQHPDVHVPTAKFTLGTHAGNERKTSGTHYTPPSLVNCLLDSALEPVLQERERDFAKLGFKSVEEGILSLKVCDEACGSGHFLIGAAHRMAKRLAAIRTGDGEPAPAAVRHALRDVIGRCLYGVDINPMAVELCKFALWLEALEPGKPLSFLDHHIQCGNALLGATPALMAHGIPDTAFEAIEGDDRLYCRRFKQANREEARGQLMLTAGIFKPWEHLGNLTVGLAQLTSLPDDSVAEVHAKEKIYAELVRSSSYESGRQLADAWCAAFVWKKCPPAAGGFDYPITNDILQKLERNPRDEPKWMRDEIKRLADQYQFFHWQLAFPDVFRVPLPKEAAENPLSGLNGGFDCILANPPWERVKLQEKEWFAERRPEIANAPNAATRKRLIEALRTEDPALHSQFRDAARQAEGESQLLRSTELYPLCGRGDINVYAVFAEGMRNHLSLNGRIGCVLPSGIATGDTTKYFFQDLVQKKSLVSLLSFFEIRLIFLATDSREPFSLLTAGSPARPATDKAEFVFFARSIEELRDPEKRFELSAEDISLLKPNTRTCPVFQNRRDAEITKQIYRRLPVLMKEGEQPLNLWRVKFATMLHMSNDSHLFRTHRQLLDDGGKLELSTFVVSGKRFLPLYEQNQIHSHDHRFATFKTRDGGVSFEASRELEVHEHSDCLCLAIPRYWVAEEAIADVCLERFGKARWTIAFRRSARSNDSRTGLFCCLPVSAVGDSVFMLTSDAPSSCERLALLLAQVAAIPFDFTVRQSIGGENASFFIMKQLPVLPPSTHRQPCAWSVNSPTLGDWLLPRVLELSYTAYDLEPFAVDCGWSGPPFRWDEERRFLLRCELDAAFFHLYGLNRDDTAYILDTFPIVKRKDEEKFGNYRTKLVILKIYDAMKSAMEGGQAFASSLPIPPADVRVTHEPRLPTEVRPALEPLVYFQLVLPLMLRLQPEGMERQRLLHALELLSDASLRQSAVASAFGEVLKQWSQNFPRGYSFSDAAGVLLTLLRDGTMQGVERCRLAAGIAVTDESAWLRLDAFAALRLAMEAPTETLQRTESKRAETVALMLQAAS